MNDLKLILWTLTPDKLPERPGVVVPLDIDLAQADGQLASHLADGWEPVSHTITPMGWPSGCYLFTLFMKRPIQAPSSPENLTACWCVSHGTIGSPTMTRTDNPKCPRHHPLDQ